METKHYEDIVAAKCKICNNIKKIRELKNITVKEMAFELCISPRAYLYLESGKVTINLTRIIEICNIFKISIEDLLKFDPNKVFIQKEN